jgi:nicotinamidase-related amidase
MIRTPYNMLIAPPPRIRLSTESVALLLMDAQLYAASTEHGLGLAARERGILREFDEYYLQVEAALRNMKRLLVACRSRQVPVIYTLLMGQRADRSDFSKQLRLSELPLPVGTLATSEISPEVAPDSADVVLQRGTYSPFVGTDLESLLRRRNVRAIIVAGFLANVVVALAAREAADRDFSVLVVRDASASETLDLHTFTMASLAGGLIRVHSTRETLEMLEGIRT